jgi:hypothetical protein
MGFSRILKIQDREFRALILLNMSGGLRHLTYQSEQIILNVLEYFEKEKQNQGSLISVMAPKRTYFATGISETTLTTIIQRPENKDKIPKKKEKESVQKRKTLTKACNMK